MWREEKVKSKMLAVSYINGSLLTRPDVHPLSRYRSPTSPKDLWKSRQSIPLPMTLQRSRSPKRLFRSALSLIHPMTSNSMALSLRQRRRSTPSAMSPTRSTGARTVSPLFLLSPLRSLDISLKQLHSDCLCGTGRTLFRRSSVIRPLFQWLTVSFTVLW